MDTNQKQQQHHGRYYAVRAGCAASASSPQGITHGSAIFFHWMDARKYIDNIKESSEHEVDFATFDSLLEAETYLMDGERGNKRMPQMQNAVAAGKKRSAPPPKLPSAKKAAASNSVRLQNVTDTLYPRGEPHSLQPNLKGGNDFDLGQNQWEHMCERLATHKAESGSLNVSKDEDEELHTWLKNQKSLLVKHFQGKSTILSNEQVNNLTALGFGQSRPGIIRASGVIDTESNEAKWNEMLEGLRGYKERTGKLSFPHNYSKVLPQCDRAIKYWVADQRREFKKLQNNQSSNMTATRMQRLSELGLDFSPVKSKVPWEQRIAGLKSFVSENGHCKVPLNHPALGLFASGIRQQYKARCEGKSTTLTDERYNDLLDLGFVFQIGKTPNVRVQHANRMTWEERFQELIDFKEVHGNCIVPQNSGPLGGWVKMQRTAYKRFKAGEKTNMTADKALKLSEIGFCFDASDRFKKKAA